MIQDDFVQSWGRIGSGKEKVKMPEGIIYLNIIR